MTEFIITCDSELKPDGSYDVKRFRELVRCKDCKYCDHPTSEKGWCKKGHLHGKAEIWFCADGEQKTGLA